MVDFLEILAPEDLVQGEFLAAVGAPIGAYQDLGGVDDPAVEQRSEGGGDVFDHLPDVGAVELAATVGATSAVDGAGQKTVEIFDAAAEERALIEEGPLAGAERDAAIDFAQQRRGLEFGEAVGGSEGIAIGGER